MIAEGIASGEARTVVPDYLGNELVLRVTGDEVRLVGNGHEIVTRRSEMLLGLEDAFTAATALVLSASDDRPLPQALDEMAAALSRWAFGV